MAYLTISIQSDDDVQALQHDLNLIKDVKENIKRLLVSLKVIQHWLLPNMLRNNGVKSEFPVHGTHQ